MYFPIGTYWKFTVELYSKNIKLNDQEELGLTNSY